jgi:hypothetical protein
MLPPDYSPADDGADRCIHPDDLDSQPERRDILGEIRYIVATTRCTEVEAMESLGIDVVWFAGQLQKLFEAVGDA